MHYFTNQYRLKTLLIMYSILHAHNTFTCMLVLYIHIPNFACTQHFYLYLYNRIPNSACTQNLYYKYCTTKHNGCTLKKESTQEYSLGFLLTHQSSNGGSDNCYSPNDSTEAWAYIVPYTQSDVYKCNKKRFLYGHFRAHGSTFVCLR